MKIVENTRISGLILHFGYLVKVLAPLGQAALMFELWNVPKKSVTIFSQFLSGCFPVISILMTGRLEVIIITSKLFK